MKFASLNVRKGVSLLLMICGMALHAQTNLAGSAAASADTSHVNYPAAAAIDGDTVDGGGWGVFAIDTVNQDAVNIAPKAIASADDFTGPPSEAIDGDTADWTGWSVSASFDEVHKYPTWSTEIKNLFDIYRKINIVFTGSSVLHLIQGIDLSRRAMVYDLPGLSFREYLEFVSGKTYPLFTLEEILENHEEIASQISEKIKPFEYFHEYLQHGYYPFFIESPKTYLQRVEAAINQTLESDLPLIKNISPDIVFKLKRILGVIAQSAPFKPNIQRISERIGVSRNSLVTYIRYLEEVKIIKQLHTSVSGIGSLQKPQMIYFENPNLIYALSELSSQIGTVRETFVLNQLSYQHSVTYPKSGDFIVDEKYTLEIGGKHKTKRQISGIENAFVVADNLEIGHGNKIPLWLTGFLH